MQSLVQTRCQKDFQEKLQKGMAAAGIDALILTSAENIYYSTGYVSPQLYLTGSPIGTDLAVVNASGRVSLIVSQFEKGGADLLTKGDVDVIAYPQWIFIEDYFDPNEKEKEVQPDTNKTFRMASEIVRSKKSDAIVGV